MISIHTTVTEKQKDRLEILSKLTGLTVSEVIRRLIDYHLHKLERSLLEDES